MWNNNKKNEGLKQKATLFLLPLKCKGIPSLTVWVTHSYLEMNLSLLWRKGNLVSEWVSLFPFICRHELCILSFFLLWFYFDSTLILLWFTWNDDENYLWKLLLFFVCFLPSSLPLSSSGSHFLSPLIFYPLFVIRERFFIFDYKTQTGFKTWGERNHEKQEWINILFPLSFLGSRMKKPLSCTCILMMNREEVVVCIQEGNRTSRQGRRRREKSFSRVCHV